jgi:S-adenosylmethionine synthetase
MSDVSEYRSAEAPLVGHPDKVADLIGDAILDDVIQHDQMGRAGIQVVVTGRTVLVCGQIRTTYSPSVTLTVRRVLSELGYDDPFWGFSPDDVEILSRIDEQSPELSVNVEKGAAGDSACIQGHACSDNADLLPMAVWLVQRLAVALRVARQGGKLPGIGPDGKLQACVEYRDEAPSRLQSLVVSLQHRDQTSLRSAHEYLRDCVLPKVIPIELMDDSTLIELRRDVGFTIGGPRADSGLSSRKVVADTYGSSLAWGGGGLSGKDPTKVDRFGSYAARCIAKRAVANGFGRSCSVMLCYAIGRSQPIATSCSMGGSDRVNRDCVGELLRQSDLSSSSVIRRLDLRRPIYSSVGFGGHFGRSPQEFPWERTDVSFLNDE